MTTNDSAAAGWAGRYFEDFAVGDVYRHPLGRTVLPTDNVWMTLLVPRRGHGPSVDVEPEWDERSRAAAGIDGA